LLPRTVFSHALRNSRKLILFGAAVLAALATVLPALLVPTQASAVVSSSTVTVPPLPRMMASSAPAVRPAQTAAHRSAPARPAPARTTVAAKPSAATACHAATVSCWIAQAEDIMAANGTSRSLMNAGAAYIVVQHESGGNPSAYNGWDANAAAGTPSEGIAQVIAPTFAAYHVPGHDNIWNPVDNMVAAFRYAIARYGSMNNIPGVVAVRAGGAYVGY
jgi:hypothetical protein